MKEYHALQKLIKVQEEQCSQIKQTVMQTLGDAETLTHLGKIIATWKSSKPSIKTDYQQLALEHPDWLIPYQSQQEGSRRLLIKEPS